MEELLLDLVYSTGLHLVHNSRATSKIWNQINKDIYMNAEFIPFKEEHYREDDYRKLRDKYVALKKEGIKFMESGNKSKFDGELSKKFSTLSRIIDEESTNESERNSKKEAELAEKNFIKETGDRIVTGKFVKRDVGKIVYHHDGTSSDNRIPKKVPRLEDYLYGKYSKDIDPQNEKDVEEKMLSWIDQKGLITEDLFNEVDLEIISDKSFRDDIERSMKLLQALGLKRIVNVFCQVGKKFCADYFRDRLKAIAVHEFLILIMFPTLESWRKDAENSCNDPRDSSNDLRDSTNRLNFSDIENVDISII